MGVLGALWEMARLPLNPPAALGANLTDMVHEAPPARMLPQLLVCVKPVLVVIEPIERPAAPLGFLRVTFSAPQVWPPSRTPNLTLPPLTLPVLFSLSLPVPPSTMP